MAPSALVHEVRVLGVLVATGISGVVLGRSGRSVFGLPLWLTVQCCGGKTLWALNRTHLDLLQEYVGARLRERGPQPGGMTLVARLPNWLKAAGNRDEVLRAISRLRASVD